MMNHSYEEEALSKQSEVIVRLEEKIQNQNQKIVDMEQKNSEKGVIMSKLVTGLLENNESMKKNLFEVENKYNASLEIIKKFMGEGDTMHEEYQKELEQLKVMNSNITDDMECIRKNHERMSKELKMNKALIDQQQKNITVMVQKDVTKMSSLRNAALKQQNDCENVLKLAKELQEQNEQFNAKMLEAENQWPKKRKQDFSLLAPPFLAKVRQIIALQEDLRIQDHNYNKVSRFETQNEELTEKVVQLENQLQCNQKLESDNQQLKGKSEVMKHKENEFLKTVGTLHMKAMQKEVLLLKNLEVPNNPFVTEENDGNNDDLQKARKKLIKGIAKISSRGDNICVKRFGKIDAELFLKAFSAKGIYDKEEAKNSALEMCSLWQMDVQDPHWYPFKIFTSDRKSKEIIVIDDEDEKLKGLKEEYGVEVYNAVVTALREIISRRFIVTEIWNKEEGRSATLEEGIRFLLSEIKMKKLKIDQLQLAMRNRVVAEGSGFSLSSLFRMFGITSQNKNRPNVPDITVVNCGLLVAEYLEVE